MQLKPSMNNKNSEKDTMDIGKLITNFGAVEMIVNNLIKRLTTHPVLIKLACQTSLTKRVEILKDLVKISELVTEKDSFLEHLNKLKPLIEIRNKVAHNPLGMGYENGDDSSELLNIGVVNLKSSGHPEGVEVISNKIINETLSGVFYIATFLQQELDSLADQ